MCSFRFTISPRYRKDIEKKLKVAQDLGELSEIKRLMVILAVSEEHSFEPGGFEQFILFHQMPAPLDFHQMPAPLDERQQQVKRFRLGC